MPRLPWEANNSMAYGKEQRSFSNENKRENEIDKKPEQQQQKQCKLRDMQKQAFNMPALHI